jgi:hypothetical protein
MAKLLMIRLTSAVGLVSLGVLFVGLIPFFGIDPTAGARTPALTVNHELKGDRLQLPANISVSRGETKQQNTTRPQEIPEGCDAAFSPISAPRLSYIYGRCMT